MRCRRRGWWGCAHRKAGNRSRHAPPGLGRYPRRGALGYSRIWIWENRLRGRRQPIRLYQVGVPSTMASPGWGW